MTEEQKQLLLKDLCSRMPYGVKALLENKSEIGIVSGISICPDGDIFVYCKGSGIYEFEGIKPYLFPLSSMTEEQYNTIPFGEFGYCGYSFLTNGCLSLYRSRMSLEDVEILIVWLKKNHFDYRDLIPKGLAINATGLGIYE